MGVRQECCGANSRIHHGVRVSNERSRPNGGVVVAEIVALEREETNGCVESAGGETEKGILPFCTVASGITTIRWRNDCLRFWRKRDADNGQCDRSE